MIRFTWKRLLRQPLPALGVLIFAAILTITLCTLNQSTEEAWSHYEEIYHQIDVRCTVTNLTGANSDGLSISNSNINDFTGYLPWLESELSAYVEDVQVKSTQRLYDNLSSYTLVGITSPEIAPELWPDNGCTVRWSEGYDESIFAGDALVCVIPEALYQRIEGDFLKVELPADPSQAYWDAEPRNYSGKLFVAGVTYGGAEGNIYCSWNVLMGIWQEMGHVETASALCATLKNNDTLDAFREAARIKFPEPDPNTDYSNWGLALDIDDSQLQQAELTLRNSLRVNEISRLLVFVLTAGAGFLIGFLMIRSRKREIALMRTMGTGNIQIYASFALEQMLCVILGACFGGITFLWQPIWQLGVFAVIYFTGLSLALLIFMRKNLLTNLKEDE